MRCTSCLRRSSWRVVCALIFAFGGSARPAAAARTTAGDVPDEVEVSVTVTAARGRDVYLNRGRASGLAADDIVVFRVAGQGTVEGVVRSVSTNNSRAELRSLAPEILEGSEGVVRVPSTRLGAAEGDASGDDPGAVEHPAWAHPPEEWSTDTPLLAPAFGLRPEERDVRFSGRVFVQYDGTWDRLRDFDSSLGRAGVRMDVTNPFGKAGRIRLDAQGNHRLYGGAGQDSSDSDLWFDRLSYAHGDTEDATERIEVGRFLQKEFPELQVLDGVEYAHTTTDGNRFGASVGAMPEPLPGMPNGNDLQAAVFYRRFVGEDRELSLGGAYQSTWHDGVADRNLFLAEVDYTPTPTSWLRSIAWIDYYSGSDTIKGSGFELTELQVQGGRKIGEDSSVSATVSHRRWPEIRRYEFQSVSRERILSNVVDRAWLSGWTDVSDVVRLRGRFGVWEDQNESGGDFELGCGLTDLFWDRGRVEVSVYGSGGAFASIEPGLRFAASRSFDRGSLYVSYDAVDLKQQDFVGSQESLIQQVLRASFDWTIDADWTLSVYADRRFGDEQDAYGGGFLLQRRF